MAGKDYQVPDLASVLKTLASFAPPANGNSSHPQSQTPDIRHVATSKAPAPEPQAAANNPKIIDPATIIDWSSGLRCVMKTVAAHENIIKEIRRMIKIQHEHEAQWWAGRQDLLKRQGTRKESQRKLNEVLKAVGGAVAEKPVEEDFAEELRVFDAKVYRAQVQMVKEMSAKLKGFGVPFFGTKAELVSRKGVVKGDGSDAAVIGEGIDSKKIDEAELVELQRRMIVILEDLCSE